MNKHLQVVIIEDEPLVARDIASKLKRIDATIEVVAQIESVEAGLEYFSNSPFIDLILSDIQLQDGVSFEIFHQKKIQVPIIFTTAFDEFAIKAFKLNSIDYLLKPILEDDLKRAIDKFQLLKNGYAMPGISQQLETMLSQLTQHTQQVYKDRFLAHYRKSIVAIPFNQVAYFQKDTLVFLVTTDNRQLITDYHSLDELEELLDPNLCYRANRQHLVTRHALEGFQVHYSGKVILKLSAGLNAEIVVSKDRAAHFKKWFA